jgi:putative DNA primase/helicase
MNGASESAEDRKPTPGRPPRPTALRLQPERIPPELKAGRRFVLWRWQWIEGRTKKWTKPPMQANGRAARANDPSTWITFEAALAIYQRGGFDGIGRMMTKEDGFTGADLDGCRDPATGKIEPWALDIVAMLPAYWEASPSGTGLRGWVRGQLPPGGRRKGRIELYDEQRYLTLTGHPIEDATSTVGEHQEQILVLHRHVFGEQSQAVPPAVEPTRLEVPDDALLERARAARNGAQFQALFDQGDLQGHGGDHSAADLALCCALAFWTNRDAAAVDRLFRRSALMRPKWDERHFADGRTYGQATVGKAVDLVREGWRPGGDGRHGQMAAGSGPPASGAPDGPPLAADGFTCTDVGNAERLIASHGDHLRYVPAWGWLAWDGRRWARDDSRATQLAVQTVRCMYRAARRAPTVEQFAELQKWAKQSEGRVRLEAMLAIAARLEPLASTAERFDRDPWLFNCRNGTIDLRTGELRHHAQDDGITRLAAVDYRPNARSESWERFLEEATAGQAGMAEFLQRAAGYTLTGETSEEYVFIAHGGAGRGKTTFLEALAAAMGDYAGSVRIEVLTDGGRTTGGHNEDIARLAGKRLVTAVEASEGERLREGLFKSLTGGDTIPASLKNKPVFDFTPAFKLWMATNHVPRMRADDEGLRRRVIKLPFDNPPAHKDKALKRRLRSTSEAREAVLAWAVGGCLEWQRSGLEPPSSITDATTRLWEAMDQVAQFLDECLVFGNEYRISSRELQGAYDAWAEEQGIPQRYRIGFKKVTDRLRSQGCDDWKDGHGARFWLGAGLADGPSTAGTARTAAIPTSPLDENQKSQRPENRAVSAVPAVNGSISYSERPPQGAGSGTVSESVPRAAARGRDAHARARQDGSDQVCQHVRLSNAGEAPRCLDCGSERRPDGTWWEVWTV